MWTTQQYPWTISSGISAICDINCNLHFFIYRDGVYGMSSSLRVLAGSVVRSMSSTQTSRLGHIHRVVKSSFVLPFSARSATDNLTTCGSLLLKQGPSTERLTWRSCEWHEQLSVDHISTYSYWGPRKVGNNAFPSALMPG